MSEPIIANFSKFPKNKHVLILGAGPTFNTNLNSITEYYEKYKPIVIASNYNYPIKSDYTVYIGKGIYGDLYKTIKSPNIIISQIVLDKKKSTIIKDEKHNYILVKGTKDSYLNCKKVTLNENGCFGHWLSNCGFTALLCSVFFEPKEVLITGMDGPIQKEKGLRHFNGTYRPFKEDHAKKSYTIAKRKFLEGPLMDFMFSKNIVVKAFKNDNLWGANKDRFSLV